MQKLNNRNIIYVEDGEDFSVIVKLKPSVSDPALEFPGVSQGFRVIGNTFGRNMLTGTLKLVPLSDSVALLRSLPKETE